MTAYWNSRAAEGWAEPVASGAPPPGVESEEERLRLRAELDAIMAHDDFGLTASEMEYILATFPTWKEREERRYGEFRTKRLILNNFNAIPESTRTGQPFVSPVNPQPRNSRACNSAIHSSP